MKIKCRYLYCYCRNEKEKGKGNGMWICLCQSRQLARQMKDKQTINFEWQTKFGQALGQTKAQKKVNKRGWRGGQQITWTLGRVGSRERETGHDFSRINEIPNGRAKCQNEMSDLNGCTHLNGPRPLPTLASEIESKIVEWTAGQLYSWMDGWMDG